jgi:hypothetical protein
MMEAVSTSEMSVNYQTTWHNIPEDSPPSYSPLWEPEILTRDRKIIYNDVKRITWKKAVVDYFKVLFRDSNKETEGKHEKLNEDRLYAYSVQNWNRVNPNTSAQRYRCDVRLDVCNAATVLMLTIPIQGLRLWRSLLCSEFMCRWMTCELITYSASRDREDEPVVTSTSWRI